MKTVSHAEELAALRAPRLGQPAPKKRWLPPFWKGWLIGSLITGAFALSELWLVLNQDDATNPNNFLCAGGIIPADQVATWSFNKSGFTWFDSGVWYQSSVPYGYSEPGGPICVFKP